MVGLTGEQKLRWQEEELEKDLDARIDSDNLPTANIMVAGIAGVGKSTLLNAVFGSELAKTGVGRPVTQHIKEYQNKDIPIHIWDTVGLELDSEKTRESIKGIKATIASKSSEQDQYDRIHAIWYCINSGSNRYQGTELEFIKELYSIGVPFIIVMTQCVGSEAAINTFEAEIRKIIDSMGMGDIDVVQVLAEPFTFRGIPEPIPAFGLDDLVNTTLQKLPTFIKSGFIAAQRVSEGEKRNISEEIIYSYVRATQKGFWESSQLINFFTIDNKVMKMFKKIGELYNTVLSEQSIEKIMKDSGVNLENRFYGLIIPYMGYSKKITNLLERKKADGFKVDMGDLRENDHVARMIAFYGYTFVDSIEILWRELTEEQLKNVDLVVDRLIGIINKKLKEREKKVKQGRG